MKSHLSAVFETHRALRCLLPPSSRANEGECECVRSVVIAVINLPTYKMSHEPQSPCAIFPQLRYYLGSECTSVTGCGTKAPKKY
jgi:hypothetical protein